MRLAFVSAPGGSAFMAELLAAVADAVTRAGGHAVCHRGSIGELADDQTVFVVVAHEYFVINGLPDADLLRRTIGFGVEHPGTATFELARKMAELLPGWMDISADGVIAMRSAGVRAERFVLGYSPMWDRRAPGTARDVDVVYLGTADERRLALLAGIAPDLVGLRTELLLPPHEPMTRPRPDFVMGEHKWQLLARSRMLLNLHRENATAFEWVRALEAIANGCVVLTEPSSDLAPLVPGEHVLVSDPKRMGLIATAALADGDRLGRMAAAADEVCRSLDMLASAQRLIAMAESVSSAPAPRPRESQPEDDVVADDGPMAVWVPCEVSLADLSEPSPPARAVGLREPVPLREAPTIERVISNRPTEGVVDLICVSGRRDGPLARTLDSLDRSPIPINRFVAFADDGDRRGSTGLWAHVVMSEPVSDGPARNALLSLGTSPYVLVLNAGDELLGDTLAELVAELDDDPSVEVVYPMAVLGSSMIMNALIPEARRLRKFAYLSRGYLVRRSWLAHLGGYCTEPDLGDLADHDFWQRTAQLRGDAARLNRRVGIRLWRRA